MTYIATMPRTIWGSLEARVGISTAEGERLVDDVHKMRLHVYLSGIKKAEVVASANLYNDAGLEIHPLIAKELGIDEIDAVTMSEEELLDKVFLSKAFKDLTRSSGVMFTRDIRPFHKRVPKSKK